MRKKEKKWEMGWDKAFGVCSSGGGGGHAGVEGNKMVNKIIYQTNLEKKKKRKFDYLFNPHNRKIRIKGNISKGRKETR